MPRRRHPIGTASPRQHLGGIPTPSGYSRSGVVLDGPAGHVAFSSDTPPLDVIVKLDGEPALIEDGDPRYEVIPRPGRKAVTHYTGHDPLRQTIPVLFDGWPGRSVEPAITKLERLQRRAKGADAPPVIYLTGAVRRTDLRWVIERIEWTRDKVIVEPSAGFRYRQSGVVTLLEHVADVLLSESIERSRGANGKGSASRYEKVKPGETTLSAFAKRVLGDRTRARDIARANSIKLSTRLKPGQRLRVPA